MEDLKEKVGVLSTGNNFYNGIDLSTNDLPEYTGFTTMNADNGEIVQNQYQENFQNKNCESVDVSHIIKPIDDENNEEGVTPPTTEELTISKNELDFKLLDMKQKFQDMKEMKNDIIEKQVNVIENQDILLHLDTQIENLSIENIKKLTNKELDKIYTFDGDNVELDVKIDDKIRAYEFKKDFLIYKKESSLAIKQIDDTMETIEKELSDNEEDLNRLINEFGDLSSYIRNKLQNDYETAESNQEKEKFKKMIECFDDALTLNVLYEHYLKFSIVNTISDYHARAEYVYEKYMQTMKLLKIKSDLSVFDNLEINFLPEKYHTYPNLFLFAVIKYFAYKRKNAQRLTDGIFLTQFIVNIKNLFTDNFKTPEDKETFIQSIQKVLDLFY